MIIEVEDNVEIELQECTNDVDKRRIISEEFVRVIPKTIYIHIDIYIFIFYIYFFMIQL